MRAAERIWNVMKLFNLREGEKTEDSRFPRRFYQEDGGAMKLDEQQIIQVLRNYYQARGWDPDSGRPSDEKIKELGLA